MAKDFSNHKYLLFLYDRVDDVLKSENIAKDELPDSIVSFCVVVEKILKIKLHDKNPFLVFDSAYIREETLSVIVLEEEKNIVTAKIKNIIDRFETVFKNVFTPDELQALRDIYEVRNCFVHGYKSDDQIAFDTDDIVKKMGTVWEKISEIAISLFGKANVKNGKPKKKYTQKELEKVLEDEVRKMIQPLRSHNHSGAFSFQPVRAFVSQQEEDQVFRIPYLASTSAVLATGDKCPRCGHYSLFFGDTKRDWLASSMYYVDGNESNDGRPDLYKCRDCHLELTEKQYEIAKRILDNDKL